jgi:hypothetical protein
MRAIRPRGRRGVPLPRRARHRLGVVRERVVGAGGQRDANDAPVGPADHAHDAGVPDRRLLDASQPQCLPPGGEGSANLLRWHAQAKDIAVDPAEPADCPGDGGQVGVGVEDVGQDAQCLALPQQSACVISGAPGGKAWAAGSGPVMVVLPCAVSE